MTCTLFKPVTRAVVASQNQPVGAQVLSSVMAAPWWKAVDVAQAPFTIRGVSGVPEVTGSAFQITDKDSLERRRAHVSNIFLKAAASNRTEATACISFSRAAVVPAFLHGLRITSTADSKRLPS